MCTTNYFTLHFSMSTPLNINLSLERTQKSCRFCSDDAKSTRFYESPGGIIDFDVQQKWHFQLLKKKAHHVD